MLSVSNFKYVIDNENDRPEDVFDDPRFVDAVREQISLFNDYASDVNALSAKYQKLVLNNYATLYNTTILPEVKQFVDDFGTLIRSEIENHQSDPNYAYELKRLSLLAYNPEIQALLKSATANDIEQKLRSIVSDFSDDPTENFQVYELQSFTKADNVNSFIHKLIENDNYKSLIKQRDKLHREVSALLNEAGFNNF